MMPHQVNREPHMSRLSVFSEIGRLRSLVIHRPGLEVDYMTPTLMHELLFDDILFGREARVEHDEFNRVLSSVVDNVWDTQTLLEEALAAEGATEHFLDRLCRHHHLFHAQRELLEANGPAALAERAITGWYEEIEDGADYRIHFPPIPNLLFMRDPAAVIGTGVSVNNMATAARKAEPLVMDTIFRFHPELRVDQESQILFDRIPSFMEGRPQHYHTLEGGDILVLSEKLVAVGISMRSSYSSVIMLAEALRADSRFERLLAVEMPEERAVMHLDTVFTQIDEEHCLVFPPFFMKGSARELPVISMDLTKKQLEIGLENNFLIALERVGHPLAPIHSGGRNALHQEREQWTDGANAFCVAPGVILGYERNVKTANALDAIGYHIVEAEQVIDGGVDLLDGKRYFVLIKGNELSRARGGPRCMTMPIRRDPVG